MSQYYYLVASLPHLFYDMDKPFPGEVFGDLCAQQLSERDYRLMQSAADFGLQARHPSCSLLERWRVWEVTLRNELAALRAQRRGWEAERFLRPGGEVIPAIQETARNAFGQESPLVAEELLLRFRWDLLDELELGHYFDIEKVISYYLRLQLLARKAQLGQEEGRVRYQEIYQLITKEYSTSTEAQGAYG